MHVRAGPLELAFSHQSETLLTADLPQHSWMGLLGTPLDDAPDVDPGPLVGDAVRAALDMAVAGPEVAAPHRHLIGELMLEVALTDSALAPYARAEHLEAWRALADTVTPIARRRCLEMAAWCDLDLPGAIA